MDSIKQILPSVIRALQKPELLARQNLVNHWPSVIGAKFAPRTKATLSGRGTLVVWVNEASLAYELDQKYKQIIHKRAQGILGEAAVQKVSIRIGEPR